MQFFTTALALLPVAMALPSGSITPDEPTVTPGPSGHEVTIEGIEFAGSGCPAGSVAGQLSDDLTMVTILYDSFIAQAGPGITPTNYRKNCQLNFKLDYPSGWQYSVFKADYRGYAYIPANATGTAKATYYFSGETDQVRFCSTRALASAMILTEIPLLGHFYHDYYW